MSRSPPRRQALLRAQGKEAKSADPAARAMSWMKTEAMLAMKPGDATTADLISTGCSMGIKSLARYCNQYSTADRTRGAAQRSAEDQLSNATIVPMQSARVILAAWRIFFGNASVPRASMQSCAVNP